MCGQSFVLCVLSFTVILFCIEREVSATPGHYTPTWSVHIEGGREVADMVAAELGFVNLGEIFVDYYHFHHHEVSKRSPKPNTHHHHRLNNHHRVKWLNQEKILSRKKRDFIVIKSRQKRISPDSTPASAEQTSMNQTPSQFQITAEGDANVRPDRELGLHSLSPERRTRLTIPIQSDNWYPLNDERWPQMWYLNRGGGLDMNVVEAWREGVTGKGIVVTILDDGLEKDHPDLKVNYDPQASYDVNNHDEDPMPRYDMIDSNRHGTRCAGEVAASANNSLCAVGIAYGANVGGVRMLDGDVTDAVEARSLSLNPQHIDIYSASWGPDDDGKTVDGPGELATRAFVEGVTKGRNGKGSIFVWASGNGGNDRDNCNCDGYTNSIWTLSISSATENGEVPWYSEMCSSTLATTYSSGSTNEKQVITTDLHHSCTSSHTGTSASAPLAAGICALALEANPELTWRDMQHIVVRTAKPANLQSTTWRVNGVGRNVSHSFGYGLMDAAAMVRMARIWKTVPMQRRCEVSSPHMDKTIPPKSQIVLQLTVSQCVGVNYLEHVQAKISLSASRRGDMEINLISPAGTRVTLLAPRPHDSSRSGFNMWPFMSVHTWGESPYGVWKLEIHNEGKFMGRAMLQQWALIFYGSATPADKNDPNPQSNVNYKLQMSQSPIPPVVYQTNKNKNKNPNKAQLGINNISPYVVTANGNPRKKNPKNSHRNSQGVNKSSIKPTVTSLRGITNKTTHSKQYGNGKGPQRQTDSRLSSKSVSTTTEHPKGVTSIPNVTKVFKFEKTTKSSKSNNLESSTSTLTMKIQKNISRLPDETRSHGPRTNSTNKKFTDKHTSTTKSYQSTADDLSTNAPNFRGYIFIDQPPEGHSGIINPKIPSLFKKYQKIQHIYPALYPNPKAEAIGNKPSRQHTPMSQFHPDIYMGGLVPQDSIESEMDHDSRIFSDKAASLTQWDLIFYGTETPTHEESLYNPLKNEFNQHDIEQSIGNSDDDQRNLIDQNRSRNWGGVDVQKVRDQGGKKEQLSQRPTGDRNSGSGCLNTITSQSQHCIECHQEFYLYGGQCYKNCPEKTFSSIKISAEVKPLILDDLKVKETPSSLKKKKNTSVNMEQFRQSINPISSLAYRDILRPVPPKYCIDCHYSCLTCTGPYVYQCSSCPGDAKLMTSYTGKISESYCYPSHILPEIYDTIWVHRFYIILGITIFTFVCFIAYFCLVHILTRSTASHRDKVSTSVGYNRLGSVDFPEKGVNIQKEISTAIFDNTDSESEGVA